MFWQIVQVNQVSLKYTSLIKMLHISNHSIKVNVLTTKQACKTLGDSVLIKSSYL